MKELVYRDILGNNPRKREISIEEINDRTESMIIRKWICKYFVKEKYGSINEEDLRGWIEMKQKSDCRRDCHILRQLDSQTGENKIICKILGDFYVIWGNMAYKIVYVNELRIQINDVMVN